MLNALWLILNFALQLTITDIAIVFFVNGARISVSMILLSNHLLSLRHLQRLPVK